MDQLSDLHSAFYLARTLHQNGRLHAFIEILVIAFLCVNREEQGTIIDRG